MDITEQILDGKEIPGEQRRIGGNDLRQLRESLAMDPEAEHICTSIDQIIMTPSLADFFSKAGHQDLSWK